MTIPRRNPPPTRMAVAARSSPASAPAGLPSGGFVRGSWPCGLKLDATETMRAPARAYRSRIHSAARELIGRIVVAQVAGNARQVGWVARVECVALEKGAASTLWRVEKGLSREKARDK